MSKRKRGVRPIGELSAQASEFLEELRKETDRGAILVAASFLENALGSLLAAALLENEGLRARLLNGSLSTMAVRTDLAYGLGLIGPQAHANLNAIREMRNAAAHSYKTTDFTSADIAPEARKLESSLGPPQRPPKTSELRLHFIVTAALLAGEILGRAKAKKPPLQRKDPEETELWKVLREQAPGPPSDSKGTGGKKLKR